MSHSQACKVKGKKISKTQKEFHQCPLDSCMNGRVGPSHHSKIIIIIIITVSDALGEWKF